MVEKFLKTLKSLIKSLAVALLFALYCVIYFFQKRIEAKFNIDLSPFLQNPPFLLVILLGGIVFTLVVQEDKSENDWRLIWFLSVVFSLLVIYLVVVVGDLNRYERCIKGFYGDSTGTGDFTRSKDVEEVKSLCDEFKRS